ncbi:MAG: flagellar hook-length control protein FliK [Desulfobacterales bacterium]|jgi:hypothetical protein
MSSNAFMLPALPQIPVSGLNGTDAKGPAAFKSSPSGESSDPGRSFSATLDRISKRQHSSNQKAKPTGKPGTTPRDSNIDSAPPQKMTKTTERPHDHLKEVETSEPKETAPDIFPLTDFGLMLSHPVRLSMSEDGFLAIEPASDSMTEPGLFMLTDLIGYLNYQQQQITGERLSIGPFEQLQFGISPEETNRSFFEQLALNTVLQQDSEGVADKTGRFFEFWQWMFPSSSAAPDGALNGQPESSGINGNVPLNPMMQILGMTGTTWGIDPDNGSSPGPEMAAGQEGSHLNKALFDRLLTLSQMSQTVVSESGKMAVADQPNAETLMEAQARQISENDQRLAVQTTIKAAMEQPANPNSASEGLTARLPEEVLDIKSAVQKSEMLAATDTRGHKISQIDTDSKDSGFLFSQDQMPPNLARLDNSTPSTEAATRGLMPQALNQIVQKAVLSLHNGQHEIQLHLKPDYLGHIRMQIVSEGQQVAIKIATEFPFVKDMLENNLHQLKADLQAQGLNIDELEVSVAHDSHAGGDLHQNAETTRLQAIKDDTECDDGSAEKPAQAQSRGGSAMAQTAIDYFA